MAQLTWHTTTRLALSGPAGWAPVERVEVHHEGGDAFIRVESWLVAPDADLDALAAAHGEQVLPDGAEDQGMTAGELLGGPGRRREVSWTHPDDARTATLLYAMRGRRMVAVTQVLPATQTGLREQADAIVASLAVSDPFELPEERLPLRPGDGVDLVEVGHAWTGGVAPASAPAHVITTEESFAAAAHYGVAMLPGADVGRWEALQAAERELVAATAWRSLEARVASGAQGLREALELAASHDLIVLFTTGEDEPRSVEWFAARPDRMARLCPTEHGAAAVTVHDTGELADLVLADRRPQPGTASAVRRHRGAVVGQETAWPRSASDEDVRAALASLLALPDRDEVRA